MKTSKTAALIAGILLGFAVWVLVSSITGKREAWDGDSGLLIYCGSLIAAGYSAGFIFPAVWIFAVAGIYFGQLAAIILKSSGDFGLLPLGLIALLIFTSASVFGAYAATLRPSKK